MGVDSYPTPELAQWADAWQQTRGLTYDLLRADLSGVQTLPGLDGLTCFVSGLTSTSSSDGDPIAVGDGFIYFVRAVDGCAGSLGTAPGAPARPSPSCP